MIVLNYQEAQKEIMLDAETSFKNFENIFNSSVKSETAGLKMALENILNDKEVVSLFEKRDRVELQNHLLPLYNSSLKPEYNIRQFQFHIDSATSFLRLHKPSKFGDDLSSFRSTVIATNRDKKTYTGIEVGRGGPGLRIVIPVKSSSGTHLGSVEFGGGIENIVKSGAELFEMDYTIGIKEGVFKKARRFTGKTTDVRKDDVIYYTYSSDLAKKYTGAMRRISIDRVVLNEHLATYSFPIYDFMDNVVGYLTLFKNLENRVHEVESRIWEFIFMIFGFMTVASLLMVFVLNKTLHPLKDFIAVLDGLTKGSTGGDLTQKLSVKYHDEVGDASKSINNFIELIKNIVQEIKIEAGHTIELNKSVEAMSKVVHSSTAEQRNLMSIAFNLSTKVKSRAGSSKVSTEETLQTILSEARMINHVMTELTGVKNSIKDTSEEGEALSKTIEKLVIEVREVKNITTMIDDVAEQTNLLALNASIEAARAGEYGKGFMVVAEEIHKLSEETQNALKMIDDKIDELIVSVSNSSSKALENSKSVIEMNKIIENLFGEMTELLHKSEAAVRASEITKESSEIIISVITDLNNHLGSVLKIINQTDERSEQLENITIAMDKSMSKLKSKMDKFKTEEESCE
jgi:methyl-accepting chemotaxis protein